MEKFINILVIDNDPANIKEIRAILGGGGNNLIFCEDEASAWPIIEKRKIGILLLNIENKSIYGLEFLQRLRINPHSKNTYKIVLSSSDSSGARLVKGFKEGAVDYIISPFDSNLVKAKIEVFKTLYFKDRRINQLLENIFPRTVLQDLDNNGKFSPKRVDEGIVLFTDFVAFTKLSKRYEPLELLQELESYFNKFDEIMDRYQLEKIKTIGDAYMVLAGVTEKNKMPAVRAVMAALEIRNYILDRKKATEGAKHPTWDIRIGIHSGPLVTGVVGTKKISFDVWGDTVNIASRAEQSSVENNITVTDNIAKHILPYFDITHRGKINVKHGGKIDMYFVDKLKVELSMFNQGRFPNRKLRIECELPPMDFEFMRNFIINKLETCLLDNLEYHSIKHTLNVEQAAIKISNLEGVTGEDLIILRTAVLFHDSGYTNCYNDNEKFAIQMVRSELPRFGYSAEQIDIITNIIASTAHNAKPKTLLEKIMCDADHDYLGRPDYQIVAKKLRRELSTYGTIMSDIEWTDFQISYLKNTHQFYTQTSINIRGKSKALRITELEELRSKLLESSL